MSSSPRPPRLSRSAAALVLATAVALPLVVQAVPSVATLSESVTHATPAEREAIPEGPHTTATDRVLFRESFDGLRSKLQPRADDPNIVDGTVGFTHEAPAGWSVMNHASMDAVGVEDWRGWSFTTRDYWTDADDQMRFRFARAQDIIAVADSDEFDDRYRGAHTFSTSLSSAPVQVQGVESVDLSFDSHYRGWAGQSAVVSVSFDGAAAREVVRFDSSTVKDNYDGAKINSNETHTIAVPAGARKAVFTWSFTAERDSWYWAIDSVSVRESLPEVSGPRTSAWVISDIQGHPRDMDHGLRDLAAVRPEASGLLTVGDQVNSGTQQQWDEFNGVMAARKDILPPVLAAAIGNHESYAREPWEVLRDRFLDYAKRDRTWGEYVLEGEGVDLPVLVIGQEEPRHPEVTMTQEQLTWFKERLAYWSKQDRQVLVISHFPLGDTHSGSWIPWYHEHYEFNTLLTRILANHPNAIMLNGHTHYPAELGDWAVQRRTEGGHPDGFWAINTLAMHVEWDSRGENTNTIDEVVTKDINRGLTVDAYRDRVVVTARDFGAVAQLGEDNTVNSVIRSVTIPNPLVK